MVRDGQSGIGKAYSKSAGFLCFPTWATVQALVPARSSLCRWELQYRSVSWEKPMCLMGIRMRSCVRSPSVHPSDVPDPSDVRDPRGPRQSKSMGSRVAPCPGEKRARRSGGTRAPDQVFTHQMRVPGPVGPSHLEEAEPGTVQAIFAWLVSFISPWLIK